MRQGGPRARVEHVTTRLQQVTAPSASANSDAGTSGRLNPAARSFRVRTGYNPEMTTGNLVATLVRHQPEVVDVLPFDIRTCPHLVLDLSENNKMLASINLADTASFTDFLFGQLATADVRLGIGRYDEDRIVYRHSPLFENRIEPRSIHIGIDLFVVSGTEVRAPIDARVHSFSDSRSIGDYGPVVILEHELDGLSFFTLYGHLSRHSLDSLTPGQAISAGSGFARLGAVHENGGWPPHLHFQIIADMQGRRGDFPGVATPSEKQAWLELCPDPNLMLQIPGI